MTKYMRVRTPVTAIVWPISESGEQDPEALERFAKADFLRRIESRIEFVIVDEPEGIE